MQQQQQRARGLSKSIVVVVIFVPQGRAALEGERESERLSGKEGERERGAFIQGKAARESMNGMGVAVDGRITRSQPPRPHYRVHY